MENNAESLPASQAPTHDQKSLLPIALGISVLLLIAGAATFFLLKKTVQTEKLSESNPKVEVLTILPPKDQRVLYTVLFDTDSHKAVYAIKKDEDTASSSAKVIVGNIQGKTYSDIDGLTISPDGKRIAYIAKQDKKEFVVLDGVEGKKYDYIKNLKFSPDGSHVAYAAGEGKFFQPDSQFSGNEMVKQMFMVVDTTEGKKFDGTYVGANIAQTYDPYFSKDGKKVAYSAIKAGKNIIVMDNKELSDYSNQMYPQFIGGTYDLIYWVSENNKDFLVVAGQKKSSYDYISDINGLIYYIGKDTSQLAYEATEGKIRSVMVNDVSYPILSGVLQDLAFSASGKYVAYYAGTWMKKDLFVNGNKVVTVQSEGTTTVRTPLFSPDERFLVYSEYNSKSENAAIHILSPDSLQKVVDLPLPGFQVVGKMKFSDDGKFLYFKGWQDRKIVFVTVNIEKLINTPPN